MLDSVVPHAAADPLSIDNAHAVARVLRSVCRETGCGSDPANAAAAVLRRWKVGPQLLNALVTMSVGGKHVCGLDAADNLWCWGGNYYGQIANPNYYFLNHPQQPGAYKFASVAAGGHHTCGLTRAAEVYCWGRNDRGQLGIGSVNSWKLTPTLIVP